MNLRFDFDDKLEQLGKIPKAARMGAVAAIVAAVFAGYYFLVYDGLREELVQTQARANEVQRQLNKVRAVANNLSDFEQEVADLERQLQVALKQLPNRKQFEDLLRDVSTAGKRVGVQIKSIKREPEIRHSFYAEVPFVIELEGRYHDIALFFDRVSKLPRIVNVSALRIDVGTEDSQATMLRVEGKASTFRFLGEEEEKVAADSKHGRGRT